MEPSKWFVSKRKVFSQVQTFRNLILPGEFKEARGWHSEALRILDWNIFLLNPTSNQRLKNPSHQGSANGTVNGREPRTGRGRGLVFSYFGYGFWMILWSFFLEQSFWRCCRYFHGCCRFSTICCPLLTISILTWQYLMYLFPTRWLCLDSHRQGRVNWLFSWVAIGSSHLECPRRLQASSPNLIWKNIQNTVYCCLRQIKRRFSTNIMPCPAKSPDFISEIIWNTTLNIERIRNSFPGVSQVQGEIVRGLELSQPFKTRADSFETPNLFGVSQIIYILKQR